MSTKETENPLGFTVYSLTADDINQKPELVQKLYGFFLQQAKRAGEEVRLELADFTQKELIETLDSRGKVIYATNKEGEVLGFIEGRHVNSDRLKVEEPGPTEYYQLGALGSNHNDVRLTYQLVKSALEGVKAKYTVISLHPDSEVGQRNIYQKRGWIETDLGFNDEYIYLYNITENVVS